MQSRYDDAFAALEAATFTIPNVRIRKPFDESGKTYPAVVLHEIANQPLQTATVTGEGRTALAYQADVQTQACVDSNGTVLSAFDANRRLCSEVTDALAGAGIVRRNITPPRANGDVIESIWRGECVADTDGYTYRK